jgi:hypothetical protein
MVLLAMTPAVAEVVQLYLDHAKHHPLPGEPSLEAPVQGNPISHGQLIDISKFLSTGASNLQLDRPDGSRLPAHLSDLLKGCSIYTPPKKPRAEQAGLCCAFVSRSNGRELTMDKTTEYKQLMARLRKEEEARQYERMLNPSPPVDGFPQPFSNSRYANIFPQPSATDEADELTYAEVDRQVALIFNVLISIVCCGAAIWIAARHWSVPTRLAISMSGAIVVGVAEVVVYMGYLRRVGEAKDKEKKKVESKEIAETWVIEPKVNGKVRTTLVGKQNRPPDGLRQRKKDLL